MVVIEVTSTGAAIAVTELDVPAGATWIAVRVKVGFLGEGTIFEGTLPSIIPTFNRVLALLGGVGLNRILLSDIL